MVIMTNILRSQKESWFSQTLYSKYFKSKYIYIYNYILSCQNFISSSWFLKINLNFFTLILIETKQTSTFNNVRWALAYVVRWVSSLNE